MLNKINALEERVNALESFVKLMKSVEAEIVTLGVIPEDPNTKDFPVLVNEDADNDQE